MKVLVMEDAVEDLENMDERLTVEASIPAGTRPNADAALLSRIVRNMATQAVKYSDAGGTVRISLQEHDDSIPLSLANTGAAIPG